MLSLECISRNGVVAIKMPVKMRVITHRERPSLDYFVDAVTDHTIYKRQSILGTSEKIKPFD